MALIILIVGVFAIFVVKTMRNKPTLSAEPVNTTVIAATVDEPTPSMMPTIHTDPKMALTYATQRLADLEADYAQKEALHQNKDIRGELINAMNANEYEYPSKMRFFMDCDQAYQALVLYKRIYVSKRT